MDERIETNNTKKESNFIDKLNKIDANIGKAVPRYIRVNKDIIKSVMYWGFNMTWQILISLVLIGAIIVGIKEIQIENLILYLFIGFFLSIVLGLIAPKIVKNKYIYKGFKSFFASKSGKYNMKNHLLKYTLIFTILLSIIFLIFRHDIVVTSADYAAWGEFILGRNLDPNSSLTIVIMYAVGVPVTGIFCYKIYNNTHREINKAMYELRHNQTLEDEYIDKSQLTEKEINDRTYIYKITEWAITHAKDAFNQTSLFQESSQAMIGVLDEKLDYSKLNDSLKRCIVFLFFMTANNILVPDAYIDTFSLIENPNQIYLCKEGKRVDAIQIEYNKDKITFTSGDGKCHCTISNAPNENTQNANLAEKEREV